MNGAHYEIRIKGRLNDIALDAFEEVESVVKPVETVLHCPIVDQAALHGLIDRIQALGLELLEVRRVSGAVNPG